MQPTATRPLRDIRFFIALAAAPIFWLLLFVAVRPQPVLDWPLREPLRFLFPALLYPVVEELIFRGLLQDSAHRYLKAWQLGPLTHANLLVSVLFTALHFINHPPGWAAAVLIPSLIFGYFKDRSGGMAAPIVLHVFYNSGYLWLFSQ
jgi:membrane protease YdiL (CAAX protease family)